MQDRYAGDLGDFLKFGLLRWLVGAQLADFASKHGGIFHRIEALSAVNGRMRVLDLKLEPVRDAVAAAGVTAVELYSSSVAADYDG